MNEQGGVKTHFVQIIEAVTNALTYYLNAGECWESPSEFGVSEEKEVCAYGPP